MELYTKGAESMQRNEGCAGNWRDCVRLNNSSFCNCGNFLKKVLIAAEIIKFFIMFFLWHSEIHFTLQMLCIVLITTFCHVIFL